MMRIINDLQAIGKKVQSALFFSTKKLPLYITIGEIPENILLFTRKQTDSVFKNPHSILRPFTENQADLLINLCSPSLLISNRLIYKNKHISALQLLIARVIMVIFWLSAIHLRQFQNDIN